MVTEGGTLTDWQIRGDWFDVCRCDIPCPCEFAQPPTDGWCQGVLAYHIREGHYGDVPLDDLSLIALGAFEGNLWTSETTGLKLGFFVDERADERQREAIMTIFSGQVGGVPAQLGAIWGHPEVLGLVPAPITFEVADDLSSWRAEIPGKVTARAEALSGPTTPAGQRVQTLNPPGSEVGPGGAATWGKATADRAEAFGFKWDRTGKSSKHIPFDWSGPGQS
jgi:hypothetical protein